MDPSEAESRDVEETFVKQGDGDAVGACRDRRCGEPAHKRSYQTPAGCRVQITVSSW